MLVLAGVDRVGPMRIPTVFVTVALAACSHDAKPTPSLAPTCPAPKQTTDVCAAVMTYAKNPTGGGCCSYGSPCQVPFDGPQFGDAACTAAASPASAPQ